MSYNGGKIIDCRTGQTLVQHAFPADLIEPVCTFSRYWNVVPLTYDKNGIVTEVPDAPYVLEEARINKIPVRKVENLLCNIFDGGTTKVYFRFADTGQKVLARHMAIKDDPLLRAELERVLGKDHVKVQTAEQNAK